MSVILKKDLPAGRESFEKWTLAAREAALRTVREGGQETGRQTAWKADTEAAAAEAGEVNVGKKTDAKENLRLNIFPFEDDRKTTGLAVRYSLHLLEQAACGDGIEVRVAPWGAVTVCDGPKSDPHNLTRRTLSSWNLTCGFVLHPVSRHGKKKRQPAIFPLSDTETICRLFSP